MIAAEHALSDRHLAPLYAAWLAPFAAHPNLERMTRELRTDPDQMRLTLAVLDERYGGTEDYLLDSGVDAADIRAVRERIVE